MPILPVVPNRGLPRRRMPSSRSRTWRARVQPLRWLLLAVGLGWAATLPAQSEVANDVELLGLATAKPGAALPSGWVTRAVRGQRLPMRQLIDSSGIRYMRLSGAGQAGWFVRELPVPLRASAGHLQWTWRATLAPLGADVGRSATDDAALRVFVVFGKHGRLALKPRVLFYTLADGIPAPDRPASPIGVRIAGRPANAREWVRASADPFGDYRAIWGDQAPPIVAIGVMQDTDQTRSPAIGDILNLFWRDDDAVHRQDLRPRGAADRL